MLNHWLIVSSPCRFHRLLSRLIQLLLPDRLLHKPRKYLLLLLPLLLLKLLKLCLISLLIHLPLRHLNHALELLSRSYDCGLLGFVHLLCVELSLFWGRYFFYNLLFNYLWLSLFRHAQVELLNYSGVSHFFLWLQFLHELLLKFGKIWHNS